MIACNVPDLMDHMGISARIWKQMEIVDFKWETIRECTEIQIR